MSKFLGEYDEIWVDDDIKIGDIVVCVGDVFRYYYRVWNIHSSFCSKIYRVIGFDEIEGVDVFLFDGYSKYYFDVRDFRKY